MGDGGRRRGRWVARAIALAVLGVAAAVSVYLGWTWADAYLTERDLRRLGIALLEVVKFAYLALVVGALAGAVGLGAAALRARRRGVRRPTLARGWLLCTSMLLGIIAAEVGAGAWRAWHHRAPSLPFRFEDQPIPGVSAGSGGEGPADGAIDVVTIGGSSAQGQPFHPNLSMGQVVAWQLNRVRPGRRFRAVVLARSGATLERMQQSLATLPRRPGVLVVYSGHNEFQGRWPWDRVVEYYDDDHPRLPGPDWFASAARVSPMCGLLQETIDFQRLVVPPLPRYGWSPIEPPATTPQEYASLLTDFRRRLESIAADCERIGTLLVLVIPAGNDAGFEPDRSVLRADTPRAEREEIGRQFLQARLAEAQDPEKALRAYRRLLGRHPEFAEAHFRVGRLLEREGHWDEASRAYVRARDLDGMPLRCPTPFREAYREVAARHPGVILIDADPVLRRLCPQGLLDDHGFGDGHHPNLLGHIALGQAILGALRARKALGWTEGPVPTIDPAECVEHFRIDRAKWEDVCRTSAYFFKATAWMRHDQAERHAKQHLYEQAADRIAAGLPPEQAGITGLGWRRREGVEVSEGARRVR